VAVGCGALAMDGTWRTFMCYNLGATETTIQAQLNYNNALGASDSAVYGHLYQWGRIGDGHQRRDAGVVAGPAPDGNYTPENTGLAGGGSRQIKPDSLTYYGKFIKTNQMPYNWTNNKNADNDLLWNQYVNRQNDPCSQSGVLGKWRIPDKQDWMSIVGGTGGSHELGNTPVNTWTWITTAGNQGAAVKPDGATTTLILPAASNRGGQTGTLYHVETQAWYWSISTAGRYSFALRIVPATINAVYAQDRVQALSVRCIADY
ncbi:hypothetical protein NO2_1649, partial [Candidatus Termititenax persephonae]